MSDEPEERTQQSVIGNYNAQASNGSTAIVNVYNGIACPEISPEKLKTALLRLSELPIGEIPHISSLPRGSRMLYQRNNTFVGREADLIQLATILKEGLTMAVGQAVAATGLGGIGKTQLAIEFVYRYGQFFEGGVFWLNFSVAESISAEIARCGSLDLHSNFFSLPLDVQVKLVLNSWNSGLPVLLIFDNCEDEDLLIPRIQPISA